MPETVPEWPPPGKVPIQDNVFYDGHIGWYSPHEITAATRLGIENEIARLTGNPKNVKAWRPEMANTLGPTGRSEMTFDIRKCLVVCTIGDREPSIQRIWQEPHEYRVIGIDYGDPMKPAPIGLHGMLTVINSPGYKWPNIKRLLDTRDGPESPRIGDQFDYYFFPDDDNDISAADVAKMFEIAHHNGLQLCQPSMSADSTEVGWEICRHVPESVFRRTNFVEIMCPCFSRTSLNVCCDMTFDANLSGWGLDFIWASLLGNRGIGIIDAVQLRHTGTGGSPNWALPNGKTPWQEMNETLPHYGLNYEQCRYCVRNL